MAHEIEGNRFFAVGSPAWHRIGTVLDNPPTIEEGIRLAGLDWSVGLAPLYTADGIEVSHRATVRTEYTATGKEETILGVVGPSYQPLQNKDAFEFFQPFLDAGKATLETAGCLKDGKKVFILARIKIDDQEIVANDPVSAYVLLSNSHDGTLAARVGFTPIRVVCNNTLSMAIQDKASQLIRVKHTTNIKQNIMDLGAIMDLASQQFSTTADQYRLLAQTDIVEADLIRYVKLVQGIPEKEHDSDKGNRVLNPIRELFEGNGMGAEIKGVRGTLWGAYNAYTEYLSHHRNNDDGKRLDSLWYGSGAVTNKQALQVALTMAQAA